MQQFIDTGSHIDLLATTSNRSASRADALSHRGREAGKGGGEGRDVAPSEKSKPSAHIREAGGIISAGAYVYPPSLIQRSKKNRSFFSRVQEAPPPLSSMLRCCRYF